MRTTEPVQISRTETVQTSCRNPPIKKIPFREMLPMQLKDKVSGKKAKTSDVACLPEILKLFSCLNKTDFETLKCPNETKALEQCYQTHRHKKAEYRQKGSLGILVPNQKLDDMTSQQINTLLRKYPITQFMKKIRW